MRPSLVLPLLVVVAPPAFGQRPQTLPPVDSAAVIKFDMKKGRDRVGHVVAADDTSLTVVTFAGARVALLQDSIKEWHRLHGSLTPGGWRPTDLTTNHLFFAPTARTTRAGSCCSVGDINVFMPTFGYGVNDRVMFSAGFSFLEGFDSAGHRDDSGLAFANAKVGLGSGRLVAAAVGAFWGRYKSEGRGGSVGAGYGVVTLGSNDHAVTVLGGYPFATAGFAPDPIVMLGGETRLTRRLKLITEFWRLPQMRGVSAMYGARWLGDEFSLELGTGSYPVWMAIKAGW